MDTASIDSFWSETRVDSSWLGRSDLRSLNNPDPAPVLDLDALQVALTRLDHSYQKGKASVGRSGALSHRRPPSRGSRSSRRSSADSLHLLLDQQEVEEDLVVPRVVNIEVQLENSSKEEEDARKKSRIEDDPPSASRKSEARPSFSEEKNEVPTPSSAKAEEDRAWEGSCCSSVDHRSEIRRRLFESRHRRSGALVGGSNPLLNHFSSEAEESYRRIKEEVTRLAAKRRSSSDISGSRPPSESEATHDHKQQLRRWSEERDSSFLESASVTLGREGEDNRSSSEADVVISDRESIADSGLVNRRTVITINEKKSKSATSLTPEDSTPLWIRDLQTRRSLRLGGKDEAASNSRVIPIHIDPDFDGGINVSIVSQPDPSRRDSTSRMYVRQSDSENRPSRASAFNVRRTIEKRQIQQERRERKALREQIREQLRSLSEGRERKDSSGSHGSSVHLSQNSVRSKSMSSLDQDDDFRSESPLFKVQSSPTLEKEKEGVRSYLFGATNLTESGESSCAGIPKTKEEPKVIRRERDNTECGSGECKEVQERPKTYAFERPDLWQWTQSWDSLKTAQQEVRETKSRSVSKSVDSVQGSNKEGSRLSCQESASSLRNSKRDKKIKKAGKTEQNVPNRIADVKDPPEADCSFISPRKESEHCEKESLASVEQLDPPEASARPVPPPRRKKLSLSAGHITLEAEEKPNWIRLAKERRSLRSTRQVEDLSDRASTTASKEPEWVARARKKLEALNVTLTSTTDFNSVSSHVTESSSAWSRGGLDALDDLREETSRIGEELAVEASARVNEDLGIKDSSRMIEHNTERSREPSAERPRVSFDASSVDASETADSSRRYRTRKSQKDEVRFGDLKHDWGGVQSKSSKNTGGKQKEMRFGEIQVKETLQEPPSPEKSKEMRFGDHMKSQPSQKTQNHSSSASGTRPVMRFGDTPLNLFPAPEAKVNQNSSKFESIAGPDPTKMTAEQLNQNVEEYDFPIPTGKEDASELMRFLEESLRKTEVVPEVVTVDDHRPKPKSILKRRSVENVLHELKREEKCEWLQKVEHRKSASFDWDSVDAPTASSPAPGEQGDSPAQAPKERRSSGADKEVQSSGTFVSQHTMEIQGAKSPAKVFSFTFSPTQTTRPETVLADFEGPSIIPASVREEVEVEKEEVGEEEEREEEVSRKVQEKNIHRSDGRRVFTIVTNPNDVRKNIEKSNTSVSPAAEGSSSKSRNIKINIQNEKTVSSKSPEIPAKPSWMKLVTQNLSNSSERRRSEDKVHDGSSSKMKVQQVTVEVVDDEEPRKRRSAKEDERRRSSLMEWEALQRQRLEDEERNRINKNLSMKPVSTKIKELVKMHGSFMSMFSKDKKTDINGTVDGKDDIVFRKVTSENSSYELNNEAVKDTTVPMKSPYIVRKLLSPVKQPIPQEVTPPQRLSRKDAAKGTPSSHKSPRVSRRDNSRSRLAEGRRDASPHKSVSENNRESVNMNGHHRHASSSPSSRYRKTSTKDSSLESTSRSRDRESSTRPSRVSQSPSRNPEVKARHKDAAHTPKSPRKASASVDLEEKSRTNPPSKEGRVKELKSQREEYDANGEVSDGSNSFSYERRRSEGRSSIKDPQKRKEWLNRMLNTISSDHLSVLEDKDQMSSENHLQPPPSPRKTHDRQLDIKDVPSAELKDSASLDPPASSSPAPTPPARKSSSKGLSADPLTSTPNKPKFTSSYLSSHPVPSSPLSPIKPAVPNKPASVILSKPSVVASDVPTSSAKLSPSLPDTPSSLRSSLRDTLQSDSSYRRGPVSLSSILGDQSSRSSSRTSTPLTSPRATPERVIKKDSLDQVPKLDVIPESSLRSSVLNTPESVGKASEPVLRSPELALKAPESVLRASEAVLRTAETFTSATETTLRTADSDLKAPESVLRASDSRTPESVSRASESVPRASAVVSRASDSVLRLSGRRSDPLCGEDQKENIAPSPSPVRCTDAKANKVMEEGRTSSNFSPSSYRSSFRLRERSEERREEDKKVSAKNNANSSWRPTSYKPFTFGKPSVTLKAMTTGVDPQRVSTSKNSNTKREQKTDTFTSQNLHTHTVSEETKAINRKTSRTETNLSSPEKKEDQISKRFSAERKSLRSRISTNDLQKTENKTTKSYDDKASSSPGPSSTFTRYSKDRTSLRSRELSERSTPDRDSSGPVSLSSILTRDVAPRTSTDEEPRDFQFKPNLSFSDELNDITLKYRKDLTTRRPSSDATHDDDDDDDDVFSRNDPTRGSSVEPESKEPSPARETKPKGRERRTNKDGATHTPGRASKESSPAPKGLPKSSSSSGSSSRPKTTKLVRRNSSLKRSRPEEAGATSRTTAKKERKDSEDDPADLKSESIVQDPSGWTKTKTTVRRARLGSFEKTRQIARTSSGRNKKEKTFKMDASKQLEEWAAGTKVQGKLMKKEGQRFSHETEEEVKGGQRTSKSVVRRVVRRGSRRLSGGGELLTETKETSSAGAKKEGQSDKPDAKTRSKDDPEGGQQLVALPPADDGLSRKMKTSTDGERYMTQSVSSKGGKTTFTTEGVNNKTTNSVEVIGGEDFEAKRHVQGKTGHRVVVESSNDTTGRPSTVVKKVTSQSRVVITKTKRKIPVVV
ncbi:serine/arginine repetitive matrix protein 2-like isoform X3 [Penaeus monodon]|uniref:serine/arginine repetitive matrix protein 2-like isoform X3 n=1 Tax=Penaeus monodon TaxID=6687 RepID=UPI0018A71B1B|nr:serine/arginine repetitive matrix protein 2-like isoform X3 [Penaeus monodon]